MSDDNDYIIELLEKIQFGVGILCSIAIGATIGQFIKVIVNNKEKSNE